MKKGPMYIEVPIRLSEVSGYTYGDPKPIDAECRDMHGYPVNIRFKITDIDFSQIDSGTWGIKVEIIPNDAPEKAMPQDIIGPRQFPNTILEGKFRFKMLHDKSTAREEAEIQGDITVIETQDH